jgi:DNA-binding response OmpR family regulator
MSEPARVVIGVLERPLRQRLCGLIAGMTQSHTIEVLTGHDALAAALDSTPDLIVLSVSLPGLDGLAVCHNIRSVAGLIDVPIVMLGPSMPPQHKYQAFYVGATDYMTIPLDAEEFSLRARVHLRAYFRRISAATELSGPGLTLHQATLSVSLAAPCTPPIQLTRSEYAILRALVEAQGKPLSAESLLQEALRRPGNYANPQLIHTHIRNLRKKLEANPDAPQRLVRLPAGYCLQEPSGL